MSLNNNLRLNVGCGNLHKDGYVNIDVAEPADMLVDLNRDIWPYSRDTVDEIVAENFLCMVSNIRHVMNEAHRVLREGGYLKTLTFDAGKHPELFFQDPAHKRGFTEVTYNYFDEISDYYKNFGVKYGYYPWGIERIKPVGSCLEVIWRPVKNGQ